MKLKNELIVICLILFILINLTAATAADNNTEIITSNDNADDNIQIINNINDNEILMAHADELIESSSSNNQSNEILSDADGGSYTDLNTKINNASSSTVTLENDYVYTSTDSSYKSGISVTKSNLVIDGDGYTIDGASSARMFNIVANNVTLKNIKFINGLFTHGGSVYFKGDVLTLINCTFENNKATGTSGSYGGGTIYGSNANVNIYDCNFVGNTANNKGGAFYIVESSATTAKCEIVNCTFFRNSATNEGGAIWLQHQSSATEYDLINQCVFINNTATTGKDIRASYGKYNLTNSIILNPVSTSIYTPSTSNFYADCNWWGNTVDDVEKPAISSNVILNKWYCLDMNVNYKRNTSTITLNNLYDNTEEKLSVDANCDLADVTFKIEAVNATVPNNVTLKDGQTIINYVRLQTTGLLTATYDTISLSKEIVKINGDFAILQDLIDDATQNTIELTRDYTYIIDVDELTTGIQITKDNLVIDGKGHTIDASGQSRIFYITANNITLKNINFINGFSTHAGALYYMGDHIDIINCTFINNTVQQITSSQGIGGAMYIRPTVYGNITGCIFIKNTASRMGDVLSTYGSAKYNISYSVFLNNGLSLINSASSTFYADYNWWGNTINDFNTRPIIKAYKWYYLDMNINDTQKIALISLNKLYDMSNQEIMDSENYNLPKLTFNIRGNNLTVQNKVTLNESGKATVNYNPTQERASITAGIEDVTLTKNINRVLGDFGKLQVLIDDATSGLIELDCNYTYDVVLDEITTGIKIAKNNIVIDGKGHTIDAKGQSRIFYVTGNNVVLKNIKLVNAKQTYAGAVYGYGDYLDIINCTFENNTATTSYGGAIYWYPDSYSRVVNSTFINNKAQYGGAICTREYTTGVTSEIINCTFIDNVASVWGGAIFDYGGNWQGVLNIFNCVFYNNTATEGSAFYSSIPHTYVSNSIFIDNPTGGVQVYADGSYVYVDDNWWGNTYENKTIAPKVNSKAILNRWLYLDIIPNIATGIATISINNVFDNETKQTSTLSTNLPSINLTLSAENATLNASHVTLDNYGKVLVNFTLSNDASITATYSPEISVTKEIMYGSFNKLQNIIRNAQDNSVIELTRDYVYGMGDTITEGIVIYNKNNLTIDGKGFTVDAAGKSRVFIVNVGSKNIVFKNINIINGARTGGGSQDYGAGLIWESSNGYVINCTFENNVGSGVSGGGALKWVGDNGHLIDCTFINNTHTYTYGGAVYWHGYNAEIINSTFINNTATAIQGGAGAIYLLNGEANIINCTFDNNTGRECGAIFDASHNKKVSNIVNCTFIRNVATTTEVGYGGGAIYAYNSSVSNSVFLENQAKYGAAIFSNYDAGQVDGCIFMNNTADSGIVLWAVGGLVKNSIFLNNNVSGAIVSTIWGNLTNKDNWYGNVWDNYNRIPDYSAYNLTNWLFLNVSDLEYDFDTQVLTVAFGFLKYDSSTQTISEYDSDLLPAVNLTISSGNVTFTKNNIIPGEEVSGTADYKGNIVVEYEKVRYVVPYKFQMDSWIEVDPELTVEISRTVTIGEYIRPFVDDVQPFLTSSKTYQSNDTSIATVDSKGKVKGVSEGVAKITIYYNGNDAMGRDKYKPSNATVIVNVTRIPTNLSLIFELGTLHVGDSSNTIVSLVDNKGSSVSGDVILINNAPNVCSLTLINRNLQYATVGEGVGNFSLIYAGSDKYLPSSLEVTFNVSRRTSTLIVSTDYIEMNITKTYYIGAYIYEISAQLDYSSNDTNVATIDDSGAIHAVGVGIANITVSYAGNDRYSPNVTYVIVNVSGVETHIEVDSLVFTANVTQTVYLNATLRDSKGNVLYQLLNYLSNDTDVATVDGVGTVSAVKEGVVNISIVFEGHNEYLPSSTSVIVNAIAYDTSIEVVSEVNLFVGDEVNLNATYSPSDAKGKLIYNSSDESVVIVSNNGKIRALSEGVATVTVKFSNSTKKYHASTAYVIVNVMRRFTEINVNDSLMLNVSDGANLNATLIPNGIGVLNYLSNDTSVVTVDENGNVVAVGEGLANVTVSFAGNSEYNPSVAYVIVKVSTIGTEIDVVGNIDLKVEDSTNLNATLTPDIAGSLDFTSNDTSVVTVDENGNVVAVGEGLAKVTVSFEGTPRYVASQKEVIINVTRWSTEIVVVGSLVLNASDSVCLNASLIPVDGGVLVYSSNDTSVVTVDDSGNVVAVGEGMAKVTVSFEGTPRYVASQKSVTIKVTRKSSKLDAEDEITMYVDDVRTILCSLIPSDGVLTFTSSNPEVVAVDENGVLSGIKIGQATVTVTYVGSDKYLPISKNVTVNVVLFQTEINVNKTIGMKIDEGLNLNASLVPAVAGGLVYSSNDTSIIEIDSNGYMTAVGVGFANITVHYPGNNKYGSSTANVIVAVNKGEIPTQINLDKEVIEIYLRNETNINAELNPNNAGKLIYESNNTNIITVDENGNIKALKIGIASVTIIFFGNNRFNASNATVKIIVLPIPTEINVNNTDITLNLTENVTLSAELNPQEAGELTYVINDTSVISIENGLIIGKSVGKAMITVSFGGNENYTVAADVVINVNVVVIDTEISVNTSDISLYVDDSTNLNATLIPGEAGSLVYSSNDTSVVSVDQFGNVVAVGAGSALITIDYIADGKYLASSAVVKVVVSKIDTSICVGGSIALNLSEGDGASVGAVLSPVGAGNLSYVSSNESVVIVGADGVLTTVGAGSAIITVSYAENNKYKASNATVNVIVSTIPTEINVTDELDLFVDDVVNLNATLIPAVAGALIFTSNDTSVISVDQLGNIVALGEGSARITVEFNAYGKYLASIATVNVTVSRIPTEIVVADNVSLFVDDVVNLNATLIPAVAGALIFTSNDTSVVSVDQSGNIVAVGEGNALIVVSYVGNNKYKSSNGTVKVVVSKIDTSICVGGSIALNLSEGDGASVGAVLSPVGAGNLSYVSSNESVVIVGADGVLTTVGAGSAIITVSYAENNKYKASNATVIVTVSTIPTEIDVVASVDLFVDDAVSLNATLIPNGAGALIYGSNDTSIVRVDQSGNIVAVGEGSALITISFNAYGKYLASDATVIVHVSRSTPVISVDADELSLFVDDAVNLNTTLTPKNAGDLIFSSDDETIASVDENGNVIARGEGETTIYIDFLGDNKYAPIQKTINVKVSRIPTSIIAENNISIEVGFLLPVGAHLNITNVANELTYSSSNESIVTVSNGYLEPNSKGSAILTVEYAGNYKYAPSNATIDVTVTARHTMIDVKRNITIVVDDRLNLNASLIIDYSIPITGELIYSSSDENVVSVDSKGNLVAHSKGSATISIVYNGSIANDPTNATVNVTITARPTSISVNKNRISLQVDKSDSIVATLTGPKNGRLIYVSSDDSVAVVDNNGNIIAIGKGTTIITVKYNGNEDYLPSSKNVTVVVSPIPTEINVTNPISLPLYDSVQLDAVLSPIEGTLNYHTSDSSIAVVNSKGKVTGMGTGTAVITVSYDGNSRYGESFKYVTVYVTLEASHINVVDSVDLSVGDSKNLNAVLTPAGIGNLIYTSSNPNVVSVDSNGRLIAIKEGNAVITIKFDGSLQYLPSNATVNVTVTKNSDAIKFIANVSEESDDASFTVKLPNNAVGTFTLLIDGKEIGTKNLEQGSATIYAKDLAPGDHKVAMKYSGDSRYSAATNVNTFHIYVLKLDKNKDITILYTGYGYYQVHLTKDTQAMGGKVITFTVNGQKLTAKTNYLGYAKVKVKLPLRAKPYVIKAQYKDVKVTNKVYVKSILVAKHTSVKKSTAKYLKVNVALKKVNGKYLSGKKITFKFNGKMCSSKTNSKGVAVFTIYKSAINKLTVGKKYSFIAKFGNDRIIKYVTVLK